MKRWQLALAAAATALAATAVPAASISAQTAWTVTPVSTGLDSPRGLSFAPDGTLYVAEGGHGGDACFPGGDGPICVGTTSQISKIDPGTGAHTPVVTGLYSRSVQREGITGVDGISAFKGRLEAVMTEFPEEFTQASCTGQPADCASSLAAARAQAGQLISFTPSGAWTAKAAVGSRDFNWSLGDSSLTRSPPNANPYGVLSIAAGTYVADAGANTLDFVTASGDETIISGLPLPAPGGFPGDSVPTCVTMIGGNLYAADLSGRFWKRNGSYTPTEVPVTAAGKSLLHHVTGCTSDGKGNVYFVDMWGTPGPPIPAGPGNAAGSGSVVELAKDGTASVLASGLDFPNGIAVAKDGSLYVTVDSTCTATGTPFPYCAKGGQLLQVKQG